MTTSDNSDDERHHEATFHQWGDEVWDLEVDTINDDDEVLDKDEVLDLDELYNGQHWMTESRE